MASVDDPNTMILSIDGVGTYDSISRRSMFGLFSTWPMEKNGSVCKALSLRKKVTLSYRSCSMWDNTGVYTNGPPKGSHQHNKWLFTTSKFRGSSCSRKIS